MTHWKLKGKMGELTYFHPPTQGLLGPYGVLPTEEVWGRKESMLILLSIWPESSKEGRHRDHKLQYDVGRLSVANRRKPRLSWKMGCKGFQEEMALEFLLEGRTGFREGMPGRKENGCGSGSPPRDWHVGEIRVVPAGLEGRVYMRRGWRVGRSQKIHSCVSQTTE